LEAVVLPFDRLEEGIRYLSELLDLGDEALFADIERECDRLERELSAFSAPVRSPNDDKTTFMTITAGAGGHEACAWVAMLLRMYYKHARRHGLSVEMIDHDPYLPDGLRSVTIRVEGKGAFGLLKWEAGVHKLSRVSPYDQADRRQTSRALVVVDPEVPKQAYVLLEKDLKVWTCRGGGKGGQAINKIESTVMMRHLPTGIMVRCQAERSQEANRKLAVEILMAKIDSARRQQEDVEQKEKRALLPKADFGEESVRTYILSQHPMVKDHRTGKQASDVDAVMDGRLDELMQV
jgi:peptide chain release factor 2